MKLDDSICRMRHSCLIVLLVALAGCSTAGTNIVTSHDPGADFSQYRFFAFADPLSVDRNGQRNSVGMTLVMATTRELMARGMQLSDVNPDVRIDIFLAQRTGIDSSGLNSAFVHAHSGMTKWRGYDSGAATARHMARDITEGTLIIDILDARSGSLVFEGIAEARITESMSENFRETANTAVADILSHLP